MVSAVGIRFQKLFGDFSLPTLVLWHSALSTIVPARREDINRSNSPDRYAVFEGYCSDVVLRRTPAPDCAITSAEGYIAQLCGKIIALSTYDSWCGVLHPVKIGTDRPERDAYHDDA